MAPVDWVKLTPDERNMLVGKTFWGLTPQQVHLYEDSNYVEDYGACHQIENEIERRGLIEAYQNALIDILGLEMQVFNSAIELDSHRVRAIPGNQFQWVGHIELWLFHRATPDQRCLAALRAVGVQI
jgi:hypothetical protein